MIFLGEQLKRLRKEMKLTQKELGELLDICNVGYSDYERGKAIPPIEKLIKLAEIHHTTIQYIVTGEESSVVFDEKNITPFPKRLQELRIKSGITQAKIAQTLQVAEVTYQRYEYGDFEPKLNKLLKLANLFDVTVDELLGRSRT